MGPAVLHPAVAFQAKQWQCTACKLPGLTVLAGARVQNRLFYFIKSNFD